MKNLLKLAEHLEGKIGQTRFDFGTVHEIYHCGTAGCAIGELPHAFPDEWQYEGLKVRLKFPTQLIPEAEINSGFVDNQVEEFFDITHSELSLLFYPYNIKYSPFAKYNGFLMLNGSASKEDVAHNIRLFADLTNEEREQLVNEDYGTY